MKPERLNNPPNQSIFRNRYFVALFVGQMISAVGDYFYWLAMMLRVRELTGSNAMMSLSMISIAIPSLLLGPLAGVMVDRWDRRKTMIVSDLGRAAVVLLCLTVHSREMVWVFFLVGFLQSTFSQFFMPARSAAVPLIVSDRHLPSANGLMQLTMVASLVVGAGSAGTIIEKFGADKAFLINSIGFLASAFAVALIHIPHTTAGRSREGGAVWREFREGLVFLGASRTLIGLIVSLAVLQLGMGALQVVFVPFLQDTFHAGPSIIGRVDATLGVGMAIGAVALGAALRCKQVWLGGGGLIVIGAFIALMGMAQTLAWFLGAAFLVGLVNPAINAGLTTIMQRVVPDLKRGRVSGATNALITLASIVSMASVGKISEMVPLRYVFYFGGALAVAAGILTLVLVEEPEAQAVMTGPEPLQEREDPLPSSLEVTVD